MDFQDVFAFAFTFAMPMRALMKKSRLCFMELQTWKWYALGKVQKQIYPVAEKGEKCKRKRVGGDYGNGLPETGHRSIYRKQVVFERSVPCHLKAAQMDHDLALLHFLLIRKGIQL